MIDQKQKKIYPFCGCLVADYNKAIFHFIRAAGVGAVLPVLHQNFLGMRHVDVLAVLNDKRMVHKGSAIIKIFPVDSYCVGRTCSSISNYDNEEC